MEAQKTLNSQSNHEEKKNGAEGINFPDFILLYKATVINMVLVQKQKCR